MAPVFDFFPGEPTCMRRPERRRRWRIVLFVASMVTRELRRQAVSLAYIETHTLNVNSIFAWLRPVSARQTDLPRPCKEM
jgi:hypothetical protein